MKIRYIYSATVVIETEDCKVICDPWWTPAYDGSWCQYPRWANSLDEAVEVLGEAQFVFVSHTHPDHFDMALLNAYLAKYPQAKVLIADHKPDLLGRKLRSRGIHPLVGYQRCGDTDLLLFPNMANTFNIDSALVVSQPSKELSVANLNDNPFDAGQIANIKSYCHKSQPTVALLPFVGAGPWPQCYEHESIEAAARASTAKHIKYLDLFSRYCQALQPKVAVPFAGQYWLHGSQLDLNPLRGMADATECETLWKHVWVPADGGQSVLTVHNEEEWSISEGRNKPYDWPTVRKALEAHDDAWDPCATDQWPAYRYEREIQVPVERLPLLKLLQSALANAHPEFKSRPELWIFIKTQLPEWFSICTQAPFVGMGVPGVGHFAFAEPRVEVYLDARYLFGMLVRLYNANSVRIGSLCRFKCVPNAYDRELDDLFGEFWDSLRV